MTQDTREVTNPRGVDHRQTIQTRWSRRTPPSRGSQGRQDADVPEVHRFSVRTRIPGTSLHYVRRGIKVGSSEPVTDTDRRVSRPTKPNTDPRPTLCPPVGRPESGTNRNHPVPLLKPTNQLFASEPSSSPLWNT